MLDLKQREKKMNKILMTGLTALLLTSCASTSPNLASPNLSSTEEQSVTIQMSSAYRPVENKFAAPSEALTEAPVQSDVAKIEAILNESKTNKRGPACPGLKLVVTCGDGKCNAADGENVTSCAADCVPAPIVSYNNQTRCTEIQNVFHPEKAEEVQEIVREAVSKGKHIKVVGNAHSANQILCTDGVVIVTNKMNHAIRIEQFEGEDTVLVESGMVISDLNEWLYDRGKGIGYAIMGFRGVTIGGAIGTGSHGSSVIHNAVISNIIQSITLVDAAGNLRDFTKGTTPEHIWKSLTANFGLLGIVTQVRLKVQPAANLDVHVTYFKESALFNTPDGVFGPVKDCDFGVMNWFPGTRKFMKVCGTVTNKKADPGATNNLLNPALPKKLVGLAKQVLQLGACSNGMGCFIEKLRYTMLKLAPPIQKFNKRGKLVSTTHAIGPIHRMVSSYLTEAQRGFFQMDWEIAVPKSRANEAMKAVLAHIRKNKICLPLVGVFLRFTPSMDESYMAHTAPGKDFINGEPAVYIEMPVYLPVGFTPAMKQAYDGVFEEFARLLITNYGARAHWGKNRDWVFAMQRDQDVYGDNLKKFQTAVDELDPKGVFQNDFSKNMGIRYSTP